LDDEKMMQGIRKEVERKMMQWEKGKSNAASEWVLTRLGFGF
jgi:hypothetical protein